jgi:hypothetical protein
MPYFVSIGIQSKGLELLIDSIRLIANPGIKNRAHITLRGPFSLKSEATKTKIKLEKFMSNSIVQISSIELFQKRKQNTVYLKINPAFNLETVWQAKKGYEDMLPPHITLYDGEDSMFARLMYENTNNHPYNIQFLCHEFELIDSRTKTNIEKNFFLIESFNFKLLNMFLESDNIINQNGSKFLIDYGSLHSMPVYQRLSLITILAQKLSALYSLELSN